LGGASGAPPSEIVSEHSHVPSQKHCEESGPSHIASGGIEQLFPGTIESGGGHGGGGGGQSGIAHWNWWPSQVHHVGMFVHCDCTIASH